VSKVFDEKPAFSSKIISIASFQGVHYYLCMIPIKIECPCGQHYAFEVEPVGGQMPHTVACPTCGADGTEAASLILTSQTITVATPPSPRGQAIVQPGEKTRSEVESEARSRIFWGMTGRRLFSS
jgi:hypothetical protein